MNLVRFLREVTMLSFPFVSRVQGPRSHQQRLGTAWFQDVPGGVGSKKLVKGRQLARVVGVGGFLTSHPSQQASLDG